MDTFTLIYLCHSDESFLSISVDKKEFLQFISEDESVVEKCHHYLFKTKLYDTFVIENNWIYPIPNETPKIYLSIVQEVKDYLAKVEGYQIHKRLDTGCCGSIYLAYDLRKHRMIVMKQATMYLFR